MGAFDNLAQNTLAFKLNAIALRDLLLLDVCQAPVYLYRDGLYHELFAAGASVDRDILRKKYREGVVTAFVGDDDFYDIQKSLELKLIKSSRSLSVGNPEENGLKKIHLLTLNLANIYRDPFNDELLQLHYQSTLNLGKFLIEHKEFLPRFFSKLSGQGHHFTLGQPLLASLALLGFLRTTHQFHDKDIEILFLASYFKDIGMSFIDEAKFDKQDLSFEERVDFSKHPEHSKRLLDGRVPLNQNQLQMIQHHHFLSERITALKRGERPGHLSQQILGIETTLVSAMDIVTASVSERPFRGPISLFEALELLKNSISKEYPTEFRAMVLFLRNFYSQLE